MNTPYVKQYDEEGKLIRPDFPIKSVGLNRRARRVTTKSVVGDAGKMFITVKVSEEGRFLGFKKMRSTLQIIPDHTDKDGDLITGKRVLHYN